MAERNDGNNQNETWGVWQYGVSIYIEKKNGLFPKPATTYWD